MPFSFLLLVRQRLGTSRSLQIRFELGNTECKTLMEQQHKSSIIISTEKDRRASSLAGHFSAAKPARYSLALLGLSIRHNKRRKISA